MSATAVIVVNYNGGRYLPRCLAALAAQRPLPAEVLVVDNASRDGSIDELPAGVEVLRCPTNLGFGAAVNAGLDATKAPFVLTLNPDTELLPGCLAAAGEALAADATLGGIALRVLQARDPARIDADGIGLTSRLGQINVDHGLPCSEAPSNRGWVLGPLGGAALWRRSALERVGGFRKDYFLYWEDFDLALRMIAEGFRFRCIPEARVLHVGSGTIGRWSSRNVFYMVRNQWTCLLSNLPVPLLRRLGPAVLVAPLRAAALYALRGRPLAALAGLACGLRLVPRACRWRGDHGAPDESAAFGARLEPLLAAADENRRVLKARR